MSEKTPSAHGNDRVLLGGGPENPLIKAFATFKAHNQGKSSRTIEAYSSYLRRLVECLGRDDLLTATEDELVYFCGPWLHKKGVMAGSRRPYIAAVREFYKWAQRTNRVRSNHAAGVGYPRAGRRLPSMISLFNAERLIWSPDLSTFAGLRDSALLGVLLGCGLRVSGLVSLNTSNLQHVDHNGQIRMVLKVTEKGEADRIVPVPRESEMMLRVYLEHPTLKSIDRALPGGDQVLFVSTGNRRISPDKYHGDRRRIAARSVRHIIADYGKRAGVPREQLHPHAFRHLFGTELAEAGVDLLVRQDLLGHTDPKHTKIYDKMAVRRKIEASDKGPMGKIKTPVSDLLQRLAPSSSSPRPPQGRAPK